MQMTNVTKKNDSRPIASTTEEYYLEHLRQYTTEKGAQNEKKSGLANSFDLFHIIHSIYGLHFE